MDPMQQIAEQMAAMDARIRLLEGGQRVGLAQTRSAWMTSAGPHAIQHGSPDFVGPGAATWQDDLGGTGTGWPKLTITTGTKVLVSWSATAAGFATSASFKSGAVGLFVHVNNVYNARAVRSVSNGSGTSLGMSIHGAEILIVAAGANTFGVSAVASITNPGGSDVTLQQANIIVTPLSVA